jgi:hypothetical protein
MTKTILLKEKETLLQKKAAQSSGRAPSAKRTRKGQAITPIFDSAALRKGFPFYPSRGVTLNKLDSALFFSSSASAIVVESSRAVPRAGLGT